MEKPLILIWLDNSAPYLKAIDEAGLTDKIELNTLVQASMPSQDTLNRVEGLIARSVPEPLIDSMPKLRWLQTLSVAVDAWLKRRDMRSNIVLTCARGVHNTQMPETIIGSLLYVSREFDVLSKQQSEHLWKRKPPEPLFGRTLGILGLGTVGSEVARKLAPFKMRVIGTKRRPKNVPHVEQVLSPENTDDVLRQSDYVLLLLPVTSNTENLIDKERLKLMKSSAYLLNFSRGKIIVDEDLIYAVKNNWIKGAVLDVFRQEPLPADHPFWDTQDIKVLPHIGGMHPERDKIVAKLFVENLDLFVDGAPLTGVVDPKEGY